MIALVLLTNFALLVMTRDQTLLETNYLAALIDKQAWLEAAPSPKIVFVGGSNLAFGLDSVAVEQRLCRPVVNMGLHAGLGMRLPLNAVRAFIHRGDIVVLSPEYSMFWGSFEGRDILNWALYLDPQMVRYLDSPGELWGLVSTFPTFVQARLITYRRTNINGESKISPYDRRSFNRNGDVIGHLGQPGLDVSQEPLSTDTNWEIDTGAVSYMNDFYSYAHAMGVETVFIFPTVPIKQYLENQADIQRINSYLVDHLSARILAAPEEVTLPLDDFYDTIYHLNAAGRQQRAQWVVERLLPFVAPAGTDGHASCK